MKSLPYLLPLGLPLTLFAGVGLSAAAISLPFESPKLILQAHLPAESQLVIDTYPTDYAGDLSLASFKSFNLGDQFSAACTKLPERIKLLRLPYFSEASKKNMRDAMLQYNVISLKQKLMPWVNAQTLEQKAFAALDPRPDSLWLWNPLRVETLIPRFTIDARSLSLQVESQDLVQKRLHALVWGNLSFDGQGIAVTSSVPLACDLASGLIQLSFQIEGRYLDPASFPKESPEPAIDSTTGAPSSLLEPTPVPPVAPLFLSYSETIPLVWTELP